MLMMPLEKFIFKNSHFAMGNSFVSQRYDTINQDNSYNSIKYTNEPTIFNINHYQQPSSGYAEDRNN